MSDDLMTNLSDEEKELLKQAETEVMSIQDVQNCLSVTNAVSATNCNMVLNTNPQVSCCFLKINGTPFCTPIMNYSQSIYKKLTVELNGEMICGNENLFDITDVASADLDNDQMNALNKATLTLKDYTREYNSCISVKLPHNVGQCISAVTNQNVKCCYFRAAENYIPSTFCNLITNEVSPIYKIIMEKTGGSIICDYPEGGPTSFLPSPFSHQHHANKSNYSIGDALSKLGIEEQEQMIQILYAMPDQTEKCMNVFNPTSISQCTTVFKSDKAKCCYIRANNRGIDQSICAPIVTELISEFRDLIEKEEGEMSCIIPPPEMSIPFKSKLAQINQYDYMTLEQALLRLYLELPKETEMCSGTLKPETASECSAVFKSNKAKCCFVKDTNTVNRFTACSPVKNDVIELYKKNIKEAGGVVDCGSKFFSYSFVLILLVTLLF
jgi:hypothetical protein